MYVIVVVCKMEINCKSGFSDEVNSGRLVFGVVLLATTLTYLYGC